MMAFSLGKRCANDGTTSGAGIMRLFNIKTTANTNMDTAATNRNINLSVIFLIIELVNERISELLILQF
jgi:hypothetical protein